MRRPLLLPHQSGPLVQKTSIGVDLADHYTMWIKKAVVQIAKEEATRCQKRGAGPDVCHARKLSMPPDGWCGWHLLIAYGDLEAWQARPRL